MTTAAVRAPRHAARSCGGASLLSGALGLWMIATSPARASFWVDDLAGPPPTREEQRAAEPAEEPVAQAGGWLQWHDARYRLSWMGHLACDSDNGIDCANVSPSGRLAAWSLRIFPMTVLNLSALRHPERVLTCGRAHARVWRGHDGYRQPDHWCNTVYATLFADWVDVTRHGVGYLLAMTPNGMPMCHSADGRTCSKAKDVDLTRRDKRRVYPLICGEPHRALYGVTGFERADHWCRLGLELDVLQSPFRRLPPAHEKSR